MANIIRYFNFTTEAPGMLMQFQIEGEKLGHILEAKIKAMALSGMDEQSIITVLKNDLKIGGPLFGSLRSAFRNTVGKTIDDISQIAITNEFKQYQSDIWMWITTSSNPCLDCRNRHQQKKTYDEWKRLGLPRSGFSVCGDHCKCVLLPVPIIRNTDVFREPVKVRPVAEFRKDFQERMQTDEDLQKRIQEHKIKVKAAREQLKNKST